MPAAATPQPGLPPDCFVQPTNGLTVPRLDGSAIKFWVVANDERRDSSQRTAGRRSEAEEGDEVNTTADHTRRARRLLGWSQVDLALASEFSRATIADFECRGRSPSALAIGKLQAALEDAGVEFLAEGSGGSVRLRTGAAAIGSDLTRSELIAARQLLGWSQSRIAQIAKINRTAVCKFELGYVLCVETFA